MNTKNNTTVKSTYSPPQISKIVLDNEISLVLQSDLIPEGDPTFTETPDYLQNNPYKANLA